MSRMWTLSNGMTASGTFVFFTCPRVVTSPVSTNHCPYFTYHRPYSNVVQVKFGKANPVVFPVHRHMTERFWPKVPAQRLDESTLDLSFYSAAAGHAVVDFLYNQGTFRKLSPANANWDKGASRAGLIARLQAWVLARILGFKQLEDKIILRAGPGLWMKETGSWSGARTGIKRSRRAKQTLSFGDEKLRSGILSTGMTKVRSTGCNIDVWIGSGNIK